MKKALSVFLVLVWAMALAGGASAEAAPVEVLFWHSMSGNAAEVLEGIVASYNETVGAEKGYVINPLYSGAYQESSVKILAIMAAGTQDAMPDLYQISARGSFEMKDNEFLMPIYQMLEADPDGLDLSVMSPASLQYASYQGKMLGYPLANSSVLMYYNKNHFEEAGLDPDVFPATLAGLAEVVEKVTVRSGEKIERFGYAVRMRQYLLSSLIPMQGEGLYMYNEENGRAGTPTAIEMTQNGSLAHFMDEWAKVLATGGVEYNDMSPNDNFISGLYSIISASSASMRSLLNLSAEAGFELGVAELVRVDENCTTGSGLGGSSVVMFDSGREGAVQGAWDFIKYLSTPEMSAKWMLGTGYYPVNTLAYELPEVLEEVEKNPQFGILRQIAERSAAYPDYLEPWTPASNEMDAMVANELVAFAEGQSKEETLTRIDEQANEFISDWWEQNN